MVCLDYKGGNWLEFIESFKNLTLVYSGEQLLIGYVMGVLVGLTGIGAGVVAMPAMIAISHLDSVTAIGTSLVFSVLSRLYGVMQHWKMGFIDKETNFWFSIGSIPGVLLASFGINYIKTIVDKQTLEYDIKLGLLVVIFVVTVYLIWDGFKWNQGNAYKCGEPLLPSQKVQGAFWGSGIGALVGATSIGGGIFIIPVLVAIFKLSAKCVVGTSNMISVALTLLGSTVYIYYGNVHYAVAFLVVAGSLPGIKLGAQMAHHMENVMLKRIMAGIALISFVTMAAGINHH